MFMELLGFPLAVTRKGYTCGGRSGTATFTWYRPAKPGARPAKDGSRMAVPIFTCTGAVTCISGAAGAGSPALIPPSTAPKPVMYTITVSPALAGDSGVTGE